VKIPAPCELPSTCSPATPFTTTKLYSYFDLCTTPRSSKKPYTITKIQQRKTHEIASRFGISTALLTVWAKNNDIPLRKRGRNKDAAPSKENRQRLELIAGGMKQEDVALATKITPQRMSSIVRRWQQLLREMRQDLADQAAG
jgi:hypothetical protein